MLGDNWEQHPEGRELASLGEMFQTKLSEIQKHFYNQWNEEITGINVQTEKDKQIFEIEQRMGKYEMVLNFNPKFFHLFKEQNNLKILGFRPSLSVTLKS